MNIYRRHLGIMDTSVVVAVIVLVGLGIWLMTRAVTYGLTGVINALQTSADHHQMGVEAQSIEDIVTQINSLPTATARDLANRLLQQATFFAAVRATEKLPSVVAERLDEETRRFFDDWEYVATAPVDRAALGRQWLQAWRKTEYMEIGGSEDTGPFLSRSDTASIFDETAGRAHRADAIPFATSIYHLLLILAETISKTDAGTT